MNYGYTNTYNPPWAYSNYQQMMQNTSPMPMQQNLAQASLPNQQQAAMNTPSIQNELMLVLVDDDNAVQNYPVASGNTVILMNYNGGKFWIKSMTNGVTPTITEHKFEVVNRGKNPQTSNFVSQKEFDALSQSVEKLQQIIDDLNS